MNVEDSWIDYETIEQYMFHLERLFYLLRRTRQPSNIMKKHHVLAYNLINIKQYKCLSL